jgi:hypothetical protein
LILRVTEDEHRSWIKLSNETRCPNLRAARGRIARNVSNRDKPPRTAMS